MIVLDTNVLSEVLKPAPKPEVLRWLARQEPLAVFTTTITVAEMFYGVEALPNGKRRERLARVVEEILWHDFRGRILSFDENAAKLFAFVATAREAKGRPVSQMDAMIAAICRAHRATPATRNESGFAHCGISLINPWKAGE
jgi:toxin FitB